MTLMTLTNPPKNLCETSSKHDVSKYASTDEEHKLRNSWEKSVSQLPLMFRQRRDDLFKMWINFSNAKGTPTIHLSSETTSFVKCFSSERGCFPAAGRRGWWAGAPGRAAVMDAPSSLYRVPWHVFNLTPAAPVDGAGWDFTALWSRARNTCASERREGERHKLKERKARRRKRNMNKHDRDFLWML